MNQAQEQHIDLILEMDSLINLEDHIFVYDGFVDQQVTKFFANQVKDILEQEEIDFLTGKRIYHVMVECFQNIHRHSDDPPIKYASRTGKKGCISVGKSESSYFVTTGNYIDKNKTTVLSERLDAINEMNHDDVKKFYKELLRKGQIGESGGAGLGFLDMKKRTKNNVAYKFKEISNQTSIVILNIEVSL